MIHPPARPSAEVAVRPAAPRSSSCGRIPLAPLGAAFIVFSVLVAGCSLLPGRQVVAKVDGHTLTLKEFSVLLRSAHGGMTPPDSIARKQIVDDWVDREEFVTEAEQQHLDSLPEVKAALHDKVELAMTDEIYRRLVLSKIKTTDAELKALYERRKHGRVVARILLANEQQAKETRGAIQKGLPFEQAAQQRSLDRMTGASGGMAGEAMAGELPLNVEEAVFALKPGEVSAPIQSSNGWDLIKLIQVRPHPEGSFADVKPSLEQLLRHRKQYDATMSTVEQLKKDRHFVILDDDIKKLVERMQRASVLADTMPPFTPAEQAGPLARFEGGPYTIADFLTDVRSAGMQGRQYMPTLTDPQQVRQFVQSRSEVRLFAAEAHRLNLDKDTRVQQRVRLARETLLAQALVSRLLKNQGEAGESELRAEYAGHRGEFINNGTAEVYEVVTSDAREATEAAREARANIDFASLQRRYSKPTAQEALMGGQARVYFDGTRPGLEDSLRNRVPGSVVGPVSWQGRTYVFKVANIFQPLNISYEQAVPTLRQRVRLAGQNKLLRDHLEGLKKRWRPEVHQNVIHDAKPAPMPNPGTPEGEE